MKSFVSVYRTATPIILTCEHASRRIPQVLGTLGLTRHELEHSKDWYDPGSLEVTKYIADTLSASYAYATYSRLYIDANRRLDAATAKKNRFHASALKTQLLVEDKAGERMVEIPKNMKGNIEREEKNRWNGIVRPFVGTVKDLISRTVEEHGHAFIVQIHSFYPTYNGDVRTIDIDILSDKAHAEAKHMIAALQKNSALKIGDNKPWSMQSADGGIFGPFQSDKVKILGIDVNNKNLKTLRAIRSIASLLSESISSTHSYIKKTRT